LAEIEGIRLLSLPMNQGVGIARKWGTMVARGRIVVWSDVDMTYPNDQIPWLVDQLDGFDHVVGARHGEGGAPNRLRGLAKWLIRRLASYLTGKAIPDLNSGFRAFRRDVADQFLHLLPKGFSCVTTLTMAFQTNGYSVKYVPIPYLARAGTSKFHWWMDTRRYLLQVIRMTLQWEPLRVFLPPAAVVGLIGIIKIGYDVIVSDFRVAADTIVLLGGAVALLLLGMVADLMVQLHKQRNTVLPTMSAPDRNPPAES
jgi:glycosyltransferase involved in cell wall biosynthesis